jgi:hypothetical protein
LAPLFSRRVRKRYLPAAVRAKERKKSRMRPAVNPEKREQLRAFLARSRWRIMDQATASWRSHRIILDRFKDDLVVTWWAELQEFDVLFNNRYMAWRNVEEISCLHQFFPVSVDDPHPSA